MVGEIKKYQGGGWRLIWKHPTSNCCFLPTAAPGGTEGKAPTLLKVMNSSHLGKDTGLEMVVGKYGCRKSVTSERMGTVFDCLSFLHSMSTKVWQSSVMTLITQGSLQ